MVTDVLVIQGASISSVIALTKFSRNIQISAPEGLTHLPLEKMTAISRSHIQVRFQI